MKTPTPTPRGASGRGSLAPVDVSAVARDDVLLNRIGGRQATPTGGLGIEPHAGAVDVVPDGRAMTEMGTDGADDPVVAMLQAFVADLDGQLVSAHSDREDDDRGLVLRVVPAVAPDTATGSTPWVAAARASVEDDELAVLSGPAARLHAVAKVLTAARGARVVREVPASAHRRPLRHRTAVSSAAAMAVAFTVSLSGVAAAVTGNPLAPYREVMQTVGIAPSDAEVSAERGVEIGRELGAADAAIERGDTVLANKFIDEAEASIEEHFDDSDVADELQEEVVELREDAAEAAASAGQDSVIAGGDSAVEGALPAPGALTDDPEASGDPSAETAPERGSDSAEPGSGASASDDTASDDPSDDTASDDPSDDPSDDTASSGSTPGSASPSADTSPSGEPTSTPSSPSSSSSPSSPTSSPATSASASGTSSPTGTSSPSTPSSSSTRLPSPSGTATTASTSTPRDKI